MRLELVPPRSAGEQRLVHEVRRRLVDVLDEDPREQLLDARILRRLEPHDASGAHEHAHARPVVEPLGVVGQPVDFVAPELGIVGHRGERVLDADRVGLRTERALQDRQRLVLLAAVEHRLADDLREVQRGVRRAELHLAELGDHLEATDLAVHLACARQRLEVVGVELPRPLVETECAFPFGDHVLDERGELEQALGLLGFATRRLQLLLEIIDRLCPIPRSTQAFPKQRTRIHLRSILPHFQKKPRPTS